MISALRLFQRLILRPLFREPIRTVLTLLAVALGVAVVLAIELAGNAAAGSFQSSIETLTGHTNLEITATGGLPDGTVARLATLPYPLRVEPRIEDYATVADSNQVVPLIGIDLISQANDYATINKSTSDDPFRDLRDPASVWVTSRLNTKTGEQLTLLINDRTRSYTVRGVLPESSGSGAVIIMDIAAAQSALGRTGRIDRILLRVPDKPSIEEWQQRIGRALPAGADVRPQGSGTAENLRMLAAFRWNLRVLSYVALIVGAFLIYNTISVSVVRRRADIGLVRALGATRTAVLAAFLCEAACFGIGGALLALPLGRVMASGAVQLLGATVSSLYVTSSPGPISLTPGTVLLAFVVGVTVTVLSALSPAREASLVAPVEAMARGRREFTARVHKNRDLLFALVLAISGVAAAKAPAVQGKPLFGYLAALLLIGASAFAIPALVDLLASKSSSVLRSMLGVEALLASRSLAGSLRRTSVLVGALSTAIAMMTAVGIMVGSFRQTVVVWMESQLPADLYLRPAGSAGVDRHPTLDVDLVERIARLPGITAVNRFRAYEISYRGLPATLASVETAVERQYRSSGFMSGRPSQQVLAQLVEPDTAIISEPFANKHHLKAGDSVTLPLGGKQVTLRIVDVYFDYSSERGYIVVDRATMLRHLPDPAPSNLAVYLAPGVGLDEARAEIEKASAGRNLMVFSNRDLRGEAIRIFDRTFAITYALEAVAIIVAVMGIAGALLALVIDRRREFGVLSFLGAAPWQLRKLILVEAGLLGLLANIAGLALGIVLSLILIYVINKQSFGWTIQFHWPVAVLVAALSLVYAATILAGLYPARIAMRLNPIEVVHEE